MPAALTALDGTILLWIQEHLRISFLNSFIVFYTNLGDNGILFLALCLCLLIHPKTRKAGFIGLGAIAVGALITNVLLKPLISRPRPYLTLELLMPLVTSHDPASFPSGHTCAAFATASALWRTTPYPWLKRSGIVLAVLMAFSRLYTGIHYPSDVLAGAIIGWLSGIVFFSLYNYIRITYHRS